MPFERLPNRVPNDSERLGISRSSSGTFSRERRDKDVIEAAIDIRDKDVIEVAIDIRDHRLVPLLFKEDSEEFLLAVSKESE